MYLNANIVFVSGYSSIRLTVTLDVFKSKTIIHIIKHKTRLTVTLDVFKFKFIKSFKNFFNRLTVTLDVFKWENINRIAIYR